MSAGASVVRTVDRNNTVDLGRGCCFVGALSPPVRKNMLLVKWDFYCVNKNI